jgi:hypothetical protein
LQSDQIYHFLSSSHEYFTREKKALFRNMTTHYFKMLVDEEEFLELSSSAYWWDEYDFDTHNWSSDDDAKNAKQTFFLIEEEFELKILVDYIRIAFFYDRLYLLSFEKFIYL